MKGYRSNSLSFSALRRVSQKISIPQRRYSQMENRQLSSTNKERKVALDEVYTQHTPFKFYRNGNATNAVAPFVVRTVFSGHQRKDIQKMKKPKFKEFSEKTAVVYKYGEPDSFGGLTLFLDTNEIKDHVWSLEHNTPLPDGLGVVWDPRMDPVLQTPFQKPPEVVPVPNSASPWLTFHGHDKHFLLVPTQEMLLSDFKQLIVSLPWKHEGKVGRMILPQQHAASGVLGTVMMGLYNWIEHFAPLAEENIDIADDLSEVVYFYEKFKLAHFAVHHKIIYLDTPQNTSFKLSPGVEMALRWFADRFSVLSVAVRVLTVVHRLETKINETDDIPSRDDLSDIAFVLRHRAITAKR